MKTILQTAAIILAVLCASGLAAAPRGKTKAQCRAELNHCLYQTCKTGGNVSEQADTACVNRCQKNAQSCMMGAKN